eukprot:Gb_30268 [translate_table: standard]
MVRNVMSSATNLKKEVNRLLPQLGSNPFSGSHRQPPGPSLKWNRPTRPSKGFQHSSALGSAPLGQGIVDNPALDVSLVSSLPMETSLGKVVGIADHSQNYIESRTFVEDIIFHDIELAIRIYRGIFVQKVANPLSKGWLRLRTIDPRDNPSVRFNYFSHSLDLQTCVQGLRIIAKLFESNSFESSGLPALHFIGRPLPDNKSDDTAMAQFCRDELRTMWHYHGGCNIGSVIDQKYKVMGTEGLRVVDASTFKDSPGTNPQATIMMLGRYQGLQILEERQSERKRSPLCEETIKSFILKVRESSHCHIN